MKIFLNLKFFILYMNQNQSPLHQRKSKFEKMYFTFPGSFIGFLAILIAIVFIGISIWFFYDELGYFSFFQVYISNLGNTPGRTMILYTIGMALLNICKILFLFYFSGYLMLIQSKKRRIWLNIVFSLMNSAGWVLMTVFSSSANANVHEIGSYGILFRGSSLAMRYFGNGI